MTVEMPFAVRLEAARQLIANSTVWRAGHEYDQVEAATHEAHRVAREAAEFVRLVRPDRDWYERTQVSMAATQRTYLVAALLGCTRCIHLRREGPQPAFAQLPLRQIVCRRCLTIVRKPPPDESDRCDVCGSGAINWFVPFLIHSGALLLSGDACSICAGVLGIESRQAVA